MLGFNLKTLVHDLLNVALKAAEAYSALTTNPIDDIAVRAASEALRRLFAEDK